MDDPPLGPGAHGVVAVLGDLELAHEDRVAPAAPRLHQVGQALGQPGLHGRQDVARGPGAAAPRPARPRQRPDPPRRDLLEQRDVPLPAAQRGGELRAQRATGGRDRAAVVDIPGQDAHGPPLSHGNRARSRRAPPVARSRPRAEGASVRLVRARAPDDGADLPEAEHPHARLLRGRRDRARRPPDGPARRGHPVVPRGIHSRHRARALPPRRGDRDPHRSRRARRGARHARHRPRDQHAHRRPPPLPGDRRPAHPRGHVRRPARPAPGLRRRRQQRRALARARRLAGRDGDRGRLAGRLRPRAAARGHAGHRPRRGGRRRERRLHRRVGEHGRRGHRRRAPRRAGALSHRRRAARQGRARTRSPCTACPRTPARRSPPRCSTARASASGSRPRTAATRRRR